MKNTPKITVASVGRITALKEADRTRILTQKTHDHLKTMPKDRLLELIEFLAMTEVQRKKVGANTNHAINLFVQDPDYAPMGHFDDAQSEGQWLADWEKKFGGAPSKDWYGNKSGKYL